MQIYLSVSLTKSNWNRANTRLVQEDDIVNPYPRSRLGNQTWPCLHATRCTGVSVINGFKVVWDVIFLLFTNILFLSYLFF